MLCALALALIGTASAAHPNQETPPAYDVQWQSPEVYLEANPYWVELRIEVGGRGATLPASALSAAAFTVDGEPLTTEAPKGEIELLAATELVVRLDLGRYLSPRADFVLANAGTEREIRAFRAEPMDRGYLEAEADGLGDFQVLMKTNRGPLLFELWPDVAPNHVKNFLELARIGFYDGILFHRIIPGFVVQAGCPRTKDPDIDPRLWGLGNGPRALVAEFNDRHHERGVLSMARSADPNSATSQFFICHGDAPSLDNKYTAFGRLVLGYETLDRIAATPTATDTENQGHGNRHRQFTDRPAHPQSIDRALVVRALGSSPEHLTEEKRLR